MPVLITKNIKMERERVNRLEDYSRRNDLNFFQQSRSSGWIFCENGVDSEQIAGHFESDWACCKTRCTLPVLQTSVIDVCTSTIDLSANLNTYLPIVSSVWIGKVSDWNNTQQKLQTTQNEYQDGEDLNSQHILIWKTVVRVPAERAYLFTSECRVHCHAVANYQHCG